MEKLERFNPFFEKAKTEALFSVCAILKTIKAYFVWFYDFFVSLSSQNIWHWLLLGSRSA